MISKLHVGLAAAGAGLAWLLFGKDSSAAEEHHPLDPSYPTYEGEVDIGPSQPDNVLDEVIVYGDPQAILFSGATQQAAFALADKLNPNGNNCLKAPNETLAFQQAYNVDPTSRHQENVLGTYNAPTYALKVDGKFGPQTATALMYVTGQMFQAVNC